MDKIKIIYLQKDGETFANRLKQLYFFTEKDGEIFWGTDNNPIDPEDIAMYLKSEKIKKLKNPLFIEEDETLHIGYKTERVFCGRPEKKELRLIGELANLVE